MNFSRTSIPDLAVLQAFEAAARHENFTKAAVELNLTQSAISRQIRTLEDQLGVSLFERIRKRVLLSTAGRRILPDARRLLAQSEALVMRARAVVDGGDVLSIATLPTFGNRWLMPRLSGFMRQYPKLCIDLTSRSQPFNLAHENIDLAIHYGQPVWAHAICTYLCSEIILPVASPTLLTEYEIEALNDMQRLPLLHLTTRPRQWAEWFHRQDIGDSDAYSGSRFDQFSMIIEAVTRGMGAGLLPLYLIEEELASGKLRVVFDRPVSTENSYFVVLPEGKVENPVAQDFQNWLIGQVAQGDDRMSSVTVAPA